MGILKEIKDRYEEWEENSEERARIRKERQAIRKEQEIIDLEREARYLKAKQKVEKLTTPKKTPKKRKEKFDSPLTTLTDLPEEKKKNFKEQWDEVF